MEKFNIDATLYLRYQNKPKIQAILETINWIDPYDDMENLVKNILNFQSYQIGSYGLDLYGTILNFSRVLAVISTNYFGFQNTDLKPFNVAPFFKGVFDYSQNLVMSNPYYKMLLKGLFLASTFDGSLHNLNIILQTIFRYTTSGQERKIVAVRSGLNSLTIISDVALEDWEKYFFSKKIIPLPIGISYSFQVQNTNTTFQTQNSTATTKKKTRRRK